MNDPPPAAHYLLLRYVNLTGIITAAGVALVGCALPHAVVINEAGSRSVGTTGDLGLRVGETTIEQAMGTLRTRGATGIAMASGLDAHDDTITLHALTADHLNGVLLFRNERLSRILEIGCDRGTARGIYLALARLKGANVILMVSERMTVDGEHGIRILTEGLGKRIHISYQYFEEWIYGMKDPLIVGGDLMDGVTFVARKDVGERPGHYVPWHWGVIIKLDGARLTVDRVFMHRLLGCRCLYQWFSSPRHQRPKAHLSAPYL